MSHGIHSFTCSRSAPKTSVIRSSVGFGYGSVSRPIICAPQLSPVRRLPHSFSFVQVTSHKSGLYTALAAFLAMASADISQLVYVSYQQMTASRIPAHPTSNFPSGYALSGNIWGNTARLVADTAQAV